MLPGVNYTSIGDLLDILAPECFVSIPISEVRVGDMVVGADAWNNGVVGRIEPGDVPDLLDTYGNNAIGDLTEKDGIHYATILRRDLLRSDLAERAAEEYRSIHEST